MTKHVVYLLYSISSCRIRKSTTKQNHNILILQL